MRACVKYLKENKIDPACSIEIGVHNGNNASVMLEELPGIKVLYLVDPYVAYVDKDSSCREWFIYDSLMVDKFRSIAEANLGLGPESYKVKFLRLSSMEAAQLFPDNVFNFVYIDACHSRPAVDHDIQAWYPKVKKGGMLGGHDYGVQDVINAVEDFAKANNIKLQKDLFETDWFIIK